MALGFFKNKGQLPPSPQLLKKILDTIITVRYITLLGNGESSNMNIVTAVVVTKFAEKQLKKLPTPIKETLRYWAESVERFGIREVRKLSGYHDEPLKGDRKGQRSVRLNRAYRAIYMETIDGIEITVIEVNKHDY